MKRLHVVNHPILEHKLAILRNRATAPHEFRQAFAEMSFMLAYEATRDLALRDEEVETPLERAKVRRVAERLVIACILRAGEGMLEGFERALPFAAIGHIGIYRDRALNATVEYYFKLPSDVKGARVLLLDPLLATGDTAIAAIERLRQYEVGPIRLITLLSSEVGLRKVGGDHPDVDIYTVSVERALNDKGFLLPGVGDAGDRLFGTV